MNVDYGDVVVPDPLILQHYDATRVTLSLHLIAQASDVDESNPVFSSFQSLVRVRCHHRQSGEPSIQKYHVFADPQPRVLSMFHRPLSNQLFRIQSMQDFEREHVSGNLFTTLKHNVVQWSESHRTFKRYFSSIIQSVSFVSKSRSMIAVVSLCATKHQCSNI